MVDCHPVRKMNTELLVRFTRYFILCQILPFATSFQSLFLSQPRSTSPVCHSGDCFLASNTLRNHRDNLKEPCNDFYEYACGNFIKTHSVPEGFVRYTALDPYIADVEAASYRFLQEAQSPNDSFSATAAKLQFRSCMDEDALDSLGLTTLLDIVKDNGGWPMIVPGDFKYTKNWQEVQDIYTRLTGKGPLYTVLVEPLNLTSPTNIITIDQPSRFPSRPLNCSNTTEVRKFITFIVNVAKKFVEASGARVSIMRLERDARKLYHFLAELDDLRRPEKYRKHGMRMAVAEALGKFQGYDANELLEQLKQFSPEIRNETNPVEAHDRMIRLLTNLSKAIAMADEKNEGGLGRQLRSEIKDLQDLYWYAKKETKMTVAEADREFKEHAKTLSFNLLSALQTIYFDVEDIILTEEEIVNVREMHYMKELLRLIERTDHRTLLNYIHFHFVERYISLTTREMRYFIRRMYNIQPQDRRVFCASMPNLSKAIARLYLKKEVTDFDSFLANFILSDVTDAIKAAILRTSFLDNSTRDEAISKLDNLITIVGHSNFYTSDQTVDRYYAKFNMGADLCRNILNYDEISYREQLAQLRVTNDRSRRRADTAPTSTEVTYSVLSNRLEIPDAALNPLAYRVMVASLANYAGLGSVIAFFLSEMFIDLGMYVNHKGDIVQWVSNSSFHTFEERTECYVDQYRNYTIKELDDAGLNFNLSSTSPRSTLASFHFALQYAYEAHKEATSKTTRLKLPYFTELNVDQQFFLAFASMHCETINPYALFKQLQESPVTTGRIKVNSALRNSPEFSRSFYCDVGTPMNPPKKCIWFD